MATEAKGFKYSPNAMDPAAVDKLRQRFLQTGDLTKKQVAMDPNSFDDGRFWVNGATLLEKEVLANNVSRLRFDLPTESRGIFLSRGVPSTVKLRAGGMFKSYDPVTMPEENDFVDFVIKGYGVREDGTKGLGQYLNDLEIGGKVDFVAKPRKLYWGKKFEDHNYPWISCICGGTGVAPFLQLTRFILREKDPKTKIFMTCANRSEEDIIALPELLKFQEDFPNNFFLKLVLSQPKLSNEEFTQPFSKGWIKKEDIHENLVSNLNEWNLNKEDGAIFVCGTRQFLDTVCGDKIKANGEKKFGPLRGILKELDFKAEQVFKM